MQKAREALCDDWNRAGTPEMKRNPARGKLAHATNGAPLVRRQIEQ
jgi:hypothetical protein